MKRKRRDKKYADIRKREINMDITKDGIMRFLIQL